MITMFIETLQALFYEHVLRSVSSNFSDIVTIGERIEHGLKTGKIAQGSPVTTGAKKHGFNPGKKKKGEVQATSTAPYWGGFQQQYRPNHGPSSAFVANAHQATHRMLIGLQLHINRHLLPIMHFSLEWEVKTLIKHKIKALVRRAILQKEL